MSCKHFWHKDRKEKENHLAARSYERESFKDGQADENVKDAYCCKIPRKKERRREEERNNSRAASIEGPDLHRLQCILGHAGPRMIHLVQSLKFGKSRAADLNESWTWESLAAPDVTSSANKCIPRRIQPLTWDTAEEEEREDEEGNETSHSAGQCQRTSRRTHKAGKYNKF